jgi:transcriptional regulator with XRE-family HTH domain
VKAWQARLGTRLRALRRARGLTQEQLAERAGLSYKFLGEIERGQGNPTLETLVALAGALDLDVVDLLGPAEPRATPPDVYTIPSRQLARVREAVAWLEEFLEQTGRPGAPRKRGRRKPG